MFLICPMGGKADTKFVPRGEKHIKFVIGDNFSKLICHKGESHG